MDLDGPSTETELAPEPEADEPVRRPLGRRWLLAMIVVGAGLFVSFGPVDAASQLQHAIEHVLPAGEGGCGGG